MDDLAVHEAVFVHCLLHVLVVVEHTQLLALGFMDGVFGQGVQIRVLQTVIIAVRAEQRTCPTITFGQELFLLAVEIDDVEVTVQHAAFIGKIIDELFIFINILDFIDLPIAGSELFDFTAQGYFVDVVESVALGSDNHRLSVFQEIIVVGHVQPFVVAVGIDDVLLLGDGVVADEIELVLMTVQFQNHSILAVGQPIDPWEVAVGVVTQIDFGEGFCGNIIDVNVHQGVVLAGFRVFVFEIGRVELVVQSEVVLLHATLVEAQEGNLATVGRPGGCA